MNDFIFRSVKMQSIMLNENYVLQFSFYMNETYNHIPSQ